MIGKRNRPIGIFDSGIGGLTVLRQVAKQLPNEKIIYFGDTARLPYGNKSAQTVTKFSLENAAFLLKIGVKLIIVACNTSCSLALNTLKRRLDVPVLGVITPAAKRAVAVSRRQRIGIIGTRATVASRCYQRQIKRINPRSRVFAAACPLFVPLAEEGWTNDDVTMRVTGRYLAPLLKKDIDTLILGCTHYPLLERMLKKVAGQNIKFVDSAQATAQAAKAVLEKKGLNAGKSVAAGEYKFYVSDEPAVFKKVGRRFLGKEIRDVRLV